MCTCKNTVNLTDGATCGKFVNRSLAGEPDGTTQLCELGLGVQLEVPKSMGPASVDGVVDDAAAAGVEEHGRAGAGASR